MDVVAVIGAREPVRVCGAVRVPAIDQLGRAQGGLHGGELTHKLRTRAGAATIAWLTVDGADVHCAASLMVGSRPVVGLQRGDNHGVAASEAASVANRRGSIPRLHVAALNSCQGDSLIAERLVHRRAVDRESVPARGVPRYQEIMHIPDATYTAVNRRIRERRAALMRHLEP